MRDTLHMIKTLIADAGISPCWHGFYISSMGSAALVFNISNNLKLYISALITDGVHGAQFMLKERGAG